MDMKSRSLTRDQPPLETFRTTELNSEEESEDYVKWQGSQTACLALNQLIKSSATEAKVETQVVDEGVSTQRGWQRQPSFDQIPGFSLLGLNTDDSPGFNSQASSLSKSVRPSIARTRSSTLRQRSPMIPPDVTNLELPIPFLGKANPLSFMDMLKGVSARLDENVSVNAGKGPAKTMKRAHRTSLGLGIASDTRQVKRGRVSAPDELESNAIRPLDKGKARYIYAHDTGQEPPDIFNHSVEDECKKLGNSSNAENYRGFASSSTISRTASRTKMPPPLLLPNKPLDPATSFEKRSLTSSSPTMNSSNLPSEPFPHTTTGSNSRNNQPGIDSKPAKLPSGPKLHPLLLEQQAKSASSAPSSSKAPAVPSTSSRAAPIATTTKVHIVHSTASIKAFTPKLGSPIPGTANASFPSSTPTISISQSSRPPALGMRRTNASSSSTGIATSLQTTGTLPSRRKGFKPPLLSGSEVLFSQVASSSQQPTTATTRASTSMTALQPQSHSLTVKHVELKCTSISGSASYDSLDASSSSSSASRPASSASPSSSSQSPPPSKTKIGASTTTKAAGSNHFVSARSTARGAVTEPIPIPASPTSPEPLDGDGDSSFGDLSFDMDALEETMKMYD